MVTICIWGKVRSLRNFFEKKGYEVTIENDKDLYWTGHLTPEIIQQWADNVTCHAPIPIDPDKHVKELYRTIEVMEKKMGEKRREISEMSSSRRRERKAHNREVSELRQENRVLRQNIVQLQKRVAQPIPPKVRQAMAVYLKNHGAGEDDGG